MVSWNLIEKINSRRKQLTIGRHHRKFKLENGILSTVFIHMEIIADFGESEVCGVLEAEAGHCGLLNESAVRI